MTLVRLQSPEHRRWRVLVPLLLGLIAAVAAPSSSAASYSWAFAPATPFDTVTTDVVWAGTDTSYPVDDDQQQVPLGFAFSFGGVLYTQVRVISNGALHLGAAQGFHKDFSNEALPVTTAVAGPGFEEPADRVILGYWDDLQPQAGGTVRYGTLGSAPDRRFVASWQNVPHYNLPGLYSLQIVLFESGGIRFRYGNATTTGASATIGVEVDDGDYSQVSHNSPLVGPLQDVVFTAAPPPACGLIPVVRPVYSGATLSIDSGTSINGSAVAAGSYGPGAGVSVGGAVIPVTLSLPIHDPVAFPGNGSSTDADENDSPFVASGAVFYDDIDIGDGENVSFGGGGPFHIDRLTVGRDSTLTLGAGVYYIDELLADRRSSINASGAPVVVHIGTRADIDRDSSVNAGGGVGGLRFLLHTGASFTLGRGSDLTGLVYGPADAGAITVRRDVLWRGAAITGGALTVERDVAFTHTVGDAATLAAITTCATTLVDHFRIEHAGLGVNCAPEPVTISAHLGDESVAVGYTGTVLLGTDTGNGEWSLAGAGGVLVDLGGGSASYTFVAADSGTATLALRNTSAETVDITVIDGAILESPGEDPPLTFAPTGFRFLAGTAPAAIGTQIAGKSSAADPGAQAIELQAIRTDTVTGACEAALTGVVAVGIAAECRDPSACGAVPVEVNGIAVAGNAAGPVSAYTSLGLDFGDASDGTADLVLSYADAGRLRLHARYELPDAAGVPSGQLMSGASNEYVVRPFGFELDFSGDRATLGTAGVSYAADAGGGPFVAAGAGFELTLRAVLWQAADDGDADGVPDAGANLADNPTTARFGDEATAVTATVTHALVAPAAGSAGALLGGVAVGGFAAGVATPTLRWSEVGIIDLAAVSGDYLGGGASVTGRVGNVGRFHPARLHVADNGPGLRDGPDPGWACAFTYMEQPFGFAADPVFTVTAYNELGGITGNYGGDFFKLAPPYLVGRGYLSTASSTATLDAPGLGTVTVGGHADLDGVATLTLSGEQLAYNRSAAPDSPFDAALTLTLAAADLSDGDACYSSTGSRCVLGAGDVPDAYAITDIRGASLRFGRLAMHNASGSELLPVAMPVRAEYFDGGGFTANTADDCSSLPVAALDLVNDGADPAPGVAVIGVGGGASSALLGNTPLAAGDAGLTFSAPLAGNTGYVQASFDLGIAALPWLRHDWDGDGAHDDDPVARATFGVLSGSPYLIHLREPWN